MADEATDVAGVEVVQASRYESVALIEMLTCKACVPCMAACAALICCMCWTLQLMGLGDGGFSLWDCSFLGTHWALVSLAATALAAILHLGKGQLRRLIFFLLHCLLLLAVSLSSFSAKLFPLVVIVGLIKLMIW